MSSDWRYVTKALNLLIVFVAVSIDGEMDDKLALSVSV